MTVVFVPVFGGLPLFCLVLVPVGLGATTTGAGAECVVVTGGGAECVVVTGAEVAVRGAEVAVTGAAVVAAGLGLCTVLWWWLTGLCAVPFFAAVVAVCVVAACDVAGEEAAGVELVVEADVPPHPATATAVAIVLSSAFFMDPAPIWLGDLAPRVQDTCDAATLRPGAR